MTYKSLPARLRSIPLKDIAAATGLEEGKLDVLAHGNLPANATEAVALGKYFNIEPIKILQEQASEELNATGYKPAAKPAKTAERTGAKSPALASHPSKGKSGSIVW